MSLLVFGMLLLLYWLVSCSTAVHHSPAACIFAGLILPKEISPWSPVLLTGTIFTMQPEQCCSLVECTGNLSYRDKFWELYATLVLMSNRDSNRVELNWIDIWPSLINKESDGIFLFLFCSHPAASCLKLPWFKHDWRQGCAIWPKSHIVLSYPDNHIHSWTKS